MNGVWSDHNVVHRCPVHAAWCPKYRRKVITGEAGTRLKAIIRPVPEKPGAHITELETMPDHVHLLIEYDPQYGTHRLARQTKGRSSRLLREESPILKSRMPTPWTNSYFVATVGGAALEIVKQYVANQRNL